MVWPQLFPDHVQHHFLVFFLVFTSYTLYHASRKTFTNVKMSISSLGVPKEANDTLSKSNFCSGTSPNGTFGNGNFPNGTFHNGTSPYGTFDNGTFPNGIFPNGIFQNGIFHNGIFHNGTFRNGTFPNGTFHSGTPPSGTFCDGTFHNGISLKGPSRDDSSIFLTTKQAILIWGTLDGVFFISYAVGLLTVGAINNLVSLRWPMALGMCLSALQYLCFSTLTKLPLFYSKWFYFITWGLNGFIEATGWPCLVAIVESWFDLTGQGYILGLWSACASLGNILGAGVASLLLQYNYKYTFFVTAIMQFVAGLNIIFTLWLSPEDPVLIDPEHRSDSEEGGGGGGGQEEEEEEEEEENEDELQLFDFFEHENHRMEFPEEIEIQIIDFLEHEDGRIAILDHYDLRDVGADGDYTVPPVFYDATSSPEMLLHPLACISIKLLKYSFFLWLPFYLNSSSGWGEAHVCLFSVWYDIEKIVAGTFQGLLSGIGQKKSVFTACMLLSIVSLMGYNHTPRNKIFNAVLMSATGLFIGGPTDVMGSIISNHVSIHEQMQGTKEALTTVTGIVDRTVSMGAAVAHYLTSFIHNHLGWMNAYYFCILMAGSTFFILSVLLLLREIRQFVHKRPTHAMRE